MATQFFTGYWNTFCKRCKQIIWGEDLKFEFSEGLLKTLFYETDIGSIPRGNQLETSNSVPKYVDSKNWNFDVKGCYWCSNIGNDLLGICCSEDCLFYFHDWCVDRTFFFTKRRFCRFPGCDKLCGSEDNLFCDLSHRNEFEKHFSKIGRSTFSSNSKLLNCPAWYDSNLHNCKPIKSDNKSTPHTPNLSKQSSSSSNSPTKTYAKAVSSSAKKQNSKEEHDHDSVLFGAAPQPDSKPKSPPDTSSPPSVGSVPANPLPRGKSPCESKESECPYMEFPLDFKNLLIFQTDVGVIPREKPTTSQLESVFAKYPNWVKETKGCYFCGNKDSLKTGNAYFCNYRCYLIFYEWCRRKIKYFTGKDLCMLPGCVTTASDGYDDCCSKEHARSINKIYGKVREIDFTKVLNAGPSWYKEKKCPDIKKTTKQSCSRMEDENTQPNSINQKLLPNKSKQSIPKPKLQDKEIKAEANQNKKEDTSPPPHPPNKSEQSIPKPKLQDKEIKVEANQNKKKDTSPPPHPPNILFGWELTQFLYYCTDIGPIPREIHPFMSPPSNIPNFNWNAEILQCYWCCSRPKQNGTVVCCSECFFLLNEWIHRKYTKLSNRKLCKYIGCNSYATVNFECCTRDHSLHYEFLKQFSPLLKTTEFALGPRWYHDFDTTPLDFYNRDEPFFEFTNFYNCSIYFNNIYWRTSEHAFQANKFVGTPLMIHVSQLETPREAFNFSRILGIQSWIRPDWHGIKLSVMLNILRQKFLQNSELADILNRTGDRRIYEHTSNDRFWGDGGDRTGANKLGEFLMRVRGELRENNPYFPTQLSHFQVLPVSIPLPLPSNTQALPSDHQKNEYVSTPVINQQSGADYQHIPGYTPLSQLSPNVGGSNDTKSGDAINCPNVAGNVSGQKIFKMELKLKERVDFNEPITTPWDMTLLDTNSTEHDASHSASPSTDLWNGSKTEVPDQTNTNPFSSSSCEPTAGTRGDTKTDTTFNENKSEGQNDSPDSSNLIDFSDPTNSNCKIPQPSEGNREIGSKSSSTSPMDSDKTTHRDNYLYTMNNDTHPESDALPPSTLLPVQPDHHQDILSPGEFGNISKSSPPILIDISPLPPSIPNVPEETSSGLFNYPKIPPLLDLSQDNNVLNTNYVGANLKDPFNSLEDPFNSFEGTFNSMNPLELPFQDNSAIQCTNLSQEGFKKNGSATIPPYTGCGGVELTSDIPTITSKDPADVPLPPEGSDDF